MTELLLSIKPLLIRATVFFAFIIYGAAAGFAVLTYEYMSVHIPGQEVVWGLKWSGASAAEQDRAQELHNTRLLTLLHQRELPLVGSGTLLGLASALLLDACLRHRRGKVGEEKDDDLLDETTEPSLVLQ